jgi:hypothetical protein
LILSINHYHQAFLLLPPFFLPSAPLPGGTVGILLRRTRRLPSDLPPLMLLALPDGAVEGFELTVGANDIDGWEEGQVEGFELSVGANDKDGWEEGQVEGFELTVGANATDGWVMPTLTGGFKGFKLTVGANEGDVLGDKDGSGEGLDEIEGLDEGSELGMFEEMEERTEQ